MQKAKNKYQKKPETRKSQQKINIEVSVSCGLARTEENCVVQVVGQQLIATNRCTKLQIAFPAWRGSHAFPPAFPHLGKSSIFPAAVVRLSGLLPKQKRKRNTPPAFLQSSFMAAKLNLHCNLLLFLGRSSGLFSFFSFLWARNGNENS